MSRNTLLLIAFAAAIALSRLAFWHDLPEWDVATYTLIGRELLHGRHLYSDIWDMKPPAIFGAYAIALFVAREHVSLAMYLLAVATSITTMLAIYFAAWKFWGKQAALWSAALWVIISAQPAIEANLTNTEALINCFLALGLATFVRHSTWRSAIAVGLLFAVATMSKHVAFVPAVACVFAWERKRSRIAITLAMIPLAWLALWGYASLTHRGQLFFDTAFVYQRFYGGNVFTNIAQAFRPANLFPHLAVEFIPLLPLAAIGLIVPSKARALLIALLVATFIAIALPGQFFRHYYQLWLLPFALAGGFGAHLLWQKKLLVRIVALLAFVGLIILQSHWFTLSPRDRLAAQHPASTVLNIVDAASEISRTLHADETMFVWADEPQLYVLTNRRPPTVPLWRKHTVEGPMRDWLTDRALIDLDRSPPDLIVTSVEPAPPGHRIAEWIDERYVPFPKDGNHFPLSFWARRGSALEQRILEPQMNTDERR